MNYNDPETVPPVWRVGDVILDRYEVKQVFTGGGMGLVYRVHHRDWDIDLAVKSPRPEFFQSQQQIENFEREAETWVNLGLHPHIISCYYVRRLGEIPFIFAEFAEGGTLADRIRTKKLYDGGKEKAMERIIDIAIQFAWGLQYAHEKGLVHQDVKPGNVLMSSDESAKVADFGLANARRASAESTTVAPHPGQSILVPGSGLMTPEYASPEQLRGEQLSRKTDIWSWAVSLLEMLLVELTWTSGLAAPALVEELFESDLNPGAPLIAILESCFGSRTHSRVTSFDLVLEPLIAHYKSRFGEYKREAPKAATLLADSINNHAVSFADLGQHKKALAEFEKILAIDGSHLNARYNIALLKWRSCIYTDIELIADLESIFRTTPNEWTLQHQLGLVNLERGDRAGAIAALKEAARLKSVETFSHSFEREPMLPTDAGNGCIHVFEAGVGSITTFSLSADERFVLIGGAPSNNWDSRPVGTTMRLFDVATGQCVRTFDALPGNIKSVYLSRDCSLAVSASASAAMRLWDVSTGKCLREFPFPMESFLLCVCLSGDNRLALSGGKSIQLWDTHSGRCIRTFNEPATLVRFSLDNKTIYSGYGPRGVKAWDITTGEERAVFDVRTPSPFDPICLTADYRFLIAPSPAGTVSMWELPKGELLQTFSSICADSFAATLDGRWMISGGAGREGHVVQLRSVKSGQCIRTFQGHKKAITCLCPTSDGKSLFSGSRDGTLRRWSLEGITRDAPNKRASLMLNRIRPTFAVLDGARQFEESLVRANCAIANSRWTDAIEYARKARAISGYERDEKALAVLNSVGIHCVRRRLTDFWRLGRFRGIKADQWCVSPDASKAISLTRSAGWQERVSVSLWNTATGECLDTFDGPHEVSDIACLCISPDNRFVAFGGGYDPSNHENEGITWIESMLTLWSLETGSECCSLWDNNYDINNRMVTNISFSPDNRLIVAQRDDQIVGLWDVATARRLRTFASAEEAAIHRGVRWARSRVWDSRMRFTALARTEPFLLEERVKNRGTAHLTKDGCFAIIDGSELEVWALDWDFDICPPKVWDEGARVELEAFLAVRVPYAGALASDRKSTEEELNLALTRQGRPTWSEEEFVALLQLLSSAGYGWLRPDGVRRELDAMASVWSEPENSQKWL